MLHALLLALSLLTTAAGPTDVLDPPDQSDTGTDQPETYSPGPWIADLKQIEKVLAERSPNLDWSVENRGLDLPLLDREAVKRLHDADSDEDARQVLRDFLTKFGDGHLSIQFPDEKPDDKQSWGSASICKGLGYQDEQRPDGLPFERVGGQIIDTPDSDTFPIETLDLPSGRLGILRIPSFYEWGFYKYCPEAVEDVGIPPDGECDQDCGAAIGRKASELLTAAVARQIQKLKDAKVDAIAVDITQNGGGSLWLDPIARMLTTTKLKTPRLTITRTSLWRTALSDDLKAINTDLANPITGLTFHGVLTKAKETLQHALAEVAKPCDRAGVWTGKKPACSLLVPDILYAGGVLEYAQPGEFKLLSSGSALFFSSLYSYEEGLWNGPLLVFMDEGSASAAEHFAELLKDNNAAVLMGEPTLGAGCGWMSVGDQPVTLNQSRAELHVPDCTWIRPDGNPEVAGLEPDVLIPWRYYDNSYQKARRLVAVLKTLDIHGSPPPLAPPVTSRAGAHP